MLGASEAPAAKAEPAGEFSGPFPPLKDTLPTIIFYACAALATAGGLAAALAPAGWRWTALPAVAVGAAGAVAALSAGFAAILVLVALGGAALALGPSAGELESRSEPVGRGWMVQLGAVGAALILLALAYAAGRGDFPAPPGPDGFFGLAAAGRVLFGREALATVAVAAMLMLGLAGGSWLLRRRVR